MQVAELGLDHRPPLPIDESCERKAKAAPVRSGCDDCRYESVSKSGKKSSVQQSVSSASTRNPTESSSDATRTRIRIKDPIHDFDQRVSRVEPTALRATCPPLKANGAKAANGERLEAADAGAMATVATARTRAVAAAKTVAAAAAAASACSACWCAQPSRRSRIPRSRNISNDAASIERRFREAVEVYAGYLLFHMSLTHLKVLVTYGVKTKAGAFANIMWV
eukprot:6210986-Pleurochrysis_carterae.AAC.2